MSTKPLQLEGRVGDPDEQRATQFHQMRMRVAELTGEVEHWRLRYEATYEDAVKYEAALKALRRQLSPLYNSLQMVFGDLDVVPDEESHIGGPANATHVVGQSTEKWESWKRKLGGKAAEFITELLTHGEMTGQQLMVATRCGKQTVYRTIIQLNKAQLLDKNGGKYRLKEI